MGNRMLKESIRTSKTINSLTDFQFRVWAYLVTYVDDYGRGSADPELLKGIVFPRMKRVSERAISDALASLARTGCIHLYEVDGESYLCFPNWGEHQRIQSRKSKFPEPAEEVRGKSRKVTVTHGDSPPETKPNRNQEEVSPAREETDDEDILSIIAKNQQADDLIRRYKLPDSDTSREALLEDENKHGFEVVEDALKRASMSNSRPMLSVTYYRKFLEAPAQGGGTQDGWDKYERF